MQLVDRLQIIVATAVLTSVGWIVVAGTVLDIGPPIQIRSPTAPVAAAPARLAAAPPIQTAIGSLMIPVAGVRADQLSDTFAEARGGGTRAHQAIDIVAPTGTPVLAAAPGTVERLFVSKDGGNTIYVRSQDRRTIGYYSHLDSYAPGLAQGQKVEQGQTIGLVGSTGNATTPHLHFAIFQTRPEANWWEPTTPINPYPLLTGR